MKKILWMCLIAGGILTFLPTYAEELEYFQGSPSIFIQLARYGAGDTNEKAALVTLEKVTGLVFSPEEVSCLHHLMSALLAKEPLPQFKHLLAHPGRSALDKISKALPHSHAKGHQLIDEKELFQIPADQIDYGRAFLLGQLKDQELLPLYEGAMDLIALEVQCSLPKEPTLEQIATQINRVLFSTLQFQFPPQSQQHLWATEFTFLPEVIDHVQGVCLGVSTLYLALGQRLNLPLEAVLPPGHIYVRYREKDVVGGTQYRNIETTMRGVALPSWGYITPAHPQLEAREKRAVLSEPFWNGAISALVSKNYPLAVTYLEKSSNYAPDDTKITEMLGYAYLLEGERSRKGLSLLSGVIRDKKEDPFQDGITEDLVSGACAPELLVYILPLPHETQEEIAKKMRALEKDLQAYPKWRCGWLILAQMQMSLRMYSAGGETLERLESLVGDWPPLLLSLTSYYVDQGLLGKGWNYFKRLKPFLPKGYADPQIDRLESEFAQEIPQLLALDQR